MDFFSDLSSKLSLAGKTVADKTKDLTELTKLNAKVVSEESKLNKAYTEIGKLYYSECQGEMADQYAEYAAAAKAALEEIEAAKEQIKNLKGVRVCAQCGKEMGKNDLYCGSCGAKNEVVVEEAPKSVDQICPVCKSVVPADVAFCPTCGEKLSEAEEETTNYTSIHASYAAEEVAEAVEDVAEAVADAVEEVVEEAADEE